MEESSPLAQYVSDETRTRSSNAEQTNSGTSPSTLCVHELAGFSLCGTEELSAATGKESVAAPRSRTTEDTSVLGVELRLTALKRVLELRKHRALTPYNPDVWEAQLVAAGLIDRYHHIPDGLRRGFSLDIPKIKITQAPPNKESIVEYRREFLSIVQIELKKGRYVGPLKFNEVESLIGPFQTSPFSIIPKPGRPGRYRVIQNYSFPHVPSAKFPNSSINSYINPDNFPSTWGTFHVLALTISRLPPGSQMAIRDVSEAYRTVPIHASQWPGSVVRISDNLFCIDTCMCFGLRPSAGAYGTLADAGLDLFRAKGIGPASRWVDDHLFIRILKEFVSSYNEDRKRWHQEITKRGRHQDGGRIWYGGHIFEDGTLEVFDEDCRFPIKDLSEASPRSHEDARFSCNLADIDEVSDDLHIPWEELKDKPFAYANSYIGFMWDLAQDNVYLPEEKKRKYLLAIDIWRRRDKHVLLDVQQLYGKLLHTSLIIPRGRVHLTSLEAMLRLTFDKPFLPRRPVKSLEADLNWWRALLQNSFVGRPIPRPLSLHDPAAYSDASSGFGIAVVIGNRWRAWRLRKGWQTLDGQKDIGWAEAVGFELLTQHVIGLGGTQKHFRVYGDNQGIIEGWRNGRSRSTSVNTVFKRIFGYIYDSPTSYSVHPTYVESKNNPADGPSRGIYGSTEFLLPSIPIAEELRRFLIDPFVVSTDPADYSTDELLPQPSEFSSRDHSYAAPDHEFQFDGDSLYFIRQHQQPHN